MVVKFYPDRICDQEAAGKDNEDFIRTLRIW